MTDKEHRAYQYLSRLWRIDREIRDKEDELRDARLTSGMRYDSVHVQTSGVPDPMSRIADLIGEIQEQHEGYISERHRLIDQIHGLEDAAFEQILVDRFINGMTMLKIRAAYGYSKPTAYRLFCQALEAFAEKYETK